jgi:hypothetical protein
MFAALLLIAVIHQPPQLSVAVVGDAGDPRVHAVKEAVAYWNHELAAAGAEVRLGPVKLKDGPRINEQTLQAISDGTISRGWFRSLPDLSVYQADVVIMLSDSELISVTHEPRRRRPGLIILREANDAPLSMPNVARNVAAHELGHILGLAHNSDDQLLMCGRPAACRPDMFRSKDAHFFPLSDKEKQELRERFTSASSPVPSGQ